MTRLAPDGRGSPEPNLVAKLPGNEVVRIEAMEDILGDLLILGKDVAIVARDINAAEIMRLCERGALRVIDLTASRPLVFR